MRQIVAYPPDMEAHLIPLANAAALGAKAYNQKPDATGAYKHFVVAADLQGRVTPISRYCRVRVQGWSVRANGTVDLADAFSLTRKFGEWLEGLAGQGIILSAEVDSGPMRVKDDVQRLEFSYLMAFLEVAV